MRGDPMRGIFAGALPARKVSYRRSLFEAPSKRPPPDSLGAGEKTRSRETTRPNSLR